MSSATGETPPPAEPGGRPDSTDTIVAPATAAGFGVRALVRLSGPRARQLVGAVLVLAPDATCSPGHVTDARLDLGDGVDCPVTLLTFLAPRSFTGEDVVEVHLPGWPVLVTELVRRFVEAGARVAAAGEFTARAVVLGRLSPDQALAVGRLTAAADPAEAAAAVSLLTGELAALHGALRSALLDVLALIEAHVDFEEEDTEAIDTRRLSGGLARARELAERLLSTATSLPAHDGETDVVLLGPPNAGKSSLLAALCPGAETTISPQPGTTRDMLEAHVHHAGRAYRLLDGPGIVEDETPLAALDRHAARRFASLLPVSAVILDVEDVSCAPAPGERAYRAALAAGRPVVRIDNKVDLPQVRATGRRPGSLGVSARDGTGLPALWEALAAAAPAPPATDLADRTEREAMTALLPSLRDAEAGDFDGALPVLALALREAVAALDARTDRSADLVEEVLTRIYATFCVGK